MERSGRGEELALVLDGGGAHALAWVWPTCRPWQRAGRVRGFVNYTQLDLVSPRIKNRWAWLDFLYWKGLGSREKKALIAGLYDDAADKGCQSVMEWNKGYYSTLPLYRSRFVAYPRYLDLCAWVFNPQLSLSGIKSVFTEQL